MIGLQSEALDLHREAQEFFLCLSVCIGSPYDHIQPLNCIINIDINDDKNCGGAVEILMKKRQQLVRQQRRKPCSGSVIKNRALKCFS